MVVGWLVPLVVHVWLAGGSWLVFRVGIGGFGADLVVSLLLEFWVGVGII